MTAYLMTRLRGLLQDELTVQQARELYERAAKRPDSDLTGDLDEGFSYWAATSLTDTGMLLKLVRCTVIRVRNAGTVHELSG